MIRRQPLFCLTAAVLVLVSFGLRSGFTAEIRPSLQEAATASSQSTSGTSSDSIRNSETPSLATQPAEDPVVTSEEAEAEGIDGKILLPFAIKAPTAKEAMQGRRLFVKSISALSQKQPRVAIAVLKGFQPTERLAQVYHSMLLSEAYRQNAQPSVADSIIEKTLQWVGSPSWRNVLVKRRLEGFAHFETSPEQKKTFYSQVVASDAARTTKADVLYAWLKLDGYNGEIKPHSDRLRSLLIYGNGDRRLDSVYNLAMAKAAPGKRSWEEEWLLLQIEARLGSFDKAIARCEAMLALNPAKAEKQKLHWQYASLLYAKRDWKRALDMVQKYLERYGDSPEAYLQEARTLDKMGETQKAQLAYDRFLNLYPRHAKASEIQWLRAWEREADGRYDEAIELYYLQLTRFPTTRRAEWANFRVGLCLFKDSNFAAAAQVFGTYRQEKSSSVLPAGMLWEAKSLERMNQVKAADSLRMVVYLNYPCSFYGHLARELLDRDAAIPDSLQPWNRFNSSRPERIKVWMQTKLPGFKDILDKSYESAYLDLSQLLELHQDTLALLTMHSTPAKVKRNPWYLFIHARRFQRYDMHPEAYKLARALVQMIPNEDLGTAPKEILRLIWPRPYEGEVLHYAIKRNLDPALLFALMRQESGFDRDIRSGAGAIGLMQLMPATAKTQADLDSLKDFHSQDLNQAEINVRLGTFYVRTLLDAYGNNPFFMLANYNAGPEPTRRWYRAYGQKPVDEMVEEISFWETRDYLKKVMGNYWTYKILYNNRIAPHSTYKANP